MVSRDKTLKCGINYSSGVLSDISSSTERNNVYTVMFLLFKNYKAQKRKNFSVIVILFIYSDNA